MAMRAEFVRVDGLETKVLTLGGWIEEEATAAQHVVLCIPGSIGLTSIYVQFLATIQSRVGVPTWVISHAGQELTWNTRERLKDNADNYSLHGQIQHKIAFINKYIPEHVKLTLIGHSIGCQMILEILKTDIHKQVDKCYLLFPAIEGMSVAPYGKLVMEKVKPCVMLILFLSWLFDLTPLAIKKTTMRGLLLLLDRSQASYAEDHVRAVRPKVLRHFFHMVFDEMVRVSSLDTEAIEAFSDKLVLYYGTSDKWVPEHCCRVLRERFPKVEVKECEHGINHVFTISSSKEMGSWVADMILGI